MSRPTVISLLLLGVLGGCGPTSPEPRPTPEAAAPAPEATNAAIEPSSEGSASREDSRRQFRAEAVAMAQSYAEQLKAALGEAVAEGGPPHAIAVCAEKAPEIAARVSTETLTIHRVGTRVRNMRTNQPTAAQQAVLDRLSSAAPEFVGEMDGTLTYMKAIIIQEAVCLNCHGPREEIAPDVLARLAEQYPDDQATGYRQGDLRGAFVVERHRSGD